MNPYKAGRNILCMLIKTGICCYLIFPAMDSNAGENASAPPSCHSPLFGAARFIGSIGDARLDECSGIDISLLTRNVFWAVNDSGNGPFLYMFGMDGRNLGRVRVKDATNRDWEGIDTFLWKGQSVILIADIGDNKARYHTHTLYIVREPRFTGERFSASASVDIAWKITFLYPDGRHDAESIAVDPVSGKVLIITKRDFPPCLYTVPLKPTTDDPPIVAEKVTEVGMIPPPTKEDLSHKYGMFRSQPTAMDISPDGLKALILTYKDIYLFSREHSGSWSAVLNKKPEIISLPLPQDREDFKQREAICFSRDGRSIYVTSEGKGAGVFRLDAR